MQFPGAGGNCLVLSERGRTVIRTPKSDNLHYSQVVSRAIYKGMSIDVACQARSRNPEVPSRNLLRTYRLNDGEYWS